jgi:hypothetical protein
MEALEMISAFITDISRHMKTTGERFIDLAKDVRYFVEVYGCYGSNRVGEEKALLVECVETRGLQ